MAHDVVVKILVQFPCQYVFESLSRLCFPGNRSRLAFLSLVGQMQFKGNFPCRTFACAGFRNGFYLEGAVFLGKLDALAAEIPGFDSRSPLFVPVPRFIQPVPAFFFA
jgi:hypothetical protein